MKGARLVTLLHSTPWALMPEVHATMCSIIDRWSRGEMVAPDVLAEIRADASQRQSRRSANSGITGSVQVIPIYGIITQRGSMMDDISGPGTTATEMLAQTLRQAVADDSVGSIVLDIDSPGGSVYGIAELADEIYQARSKKPVTAIANSLAASAAYWLGSQASEFFVTPGGEVGSIGVIAEHRDVSALNEKMGLKVTYITAGKHKSEGNPNEPLGDDARTYEQSRVDDYYAMFTGAVSRGRGVGTAKVRGSGFGMGRVLGAKAAVDSGMVDGVRSFDQVIGHAKQLAKQPRAKAIGSTSTTAQVQQAHLRNRIRISQQR